MSETAPPHRPHVVFDSVVFVQALISGRGPAAACIDRVKAGAVVLFLSNAVVAEMREVPLRPELTRRYRHLTTDRVERFVGDVQACAVHISNPPKAFHLPRDPDDEAVIDLAVACGARYLVTWKCAAPDVLDDGGCT